MILSRDERSEPHTALREQDLFGNTDGAAVAGSKFPAAASKVAGAPMESCRFVSVDATAKPSFRKSSLIPTQPCGRRVAHIHPSGWLRAFRALTARPVREARELDLHFIVYFVCAHLRGASFGTRLNGENRPIIVLVMAQVR